MPSRSAVKINCSQAESDLIHEQAQAQRRSISGYVLKVVLGHVSTEETFIARSLQRADFLSGWKRPVKVPGPRTTFLIRCSGEEAERIRAAAKRRGWSTSGYVLNTLRHSWKVQTKIGAMFPSGTHQALNLQGDWALKP